MPGQPLSPGQHRLYRGDFNTMQQVWQPDGSVILHLYSHGEPNKTVIHVSDLYGPNETVIEEHLEDMTPPGHVKSRQAQAQQ